MVRYLCTDISPNPFNSIINIMDKTFDSHKCILKCYGLFPDLAKVGVEYNIIYYVMSVCNKGEGTVCGPLKEGEEFYTEKKERKVYFCKKYKN